MLVCAYDRGVDHHVFVVGVIRQIEHLPTLEKDRTPKEAPPERGSWRVLRAGSVTRFEAKSRATSPRGKSKAPAARSISAGEIQLCGWAERH